MIVSLSRRAKRIFLFGFDWALVPVTLTLAYSVRYGVAFPTDQLIASNLVAFVVIAAAPFVIFLLRLTQIKLSTLDMRGALRIAVVAAILGGLASLSSVIFDVGSPRSIPVIFAASFFASAFLGRVIAIQLLQGSRRRSGATPIAIFGAGAAGIQLSSALRQCREVRAVCFVDDDPNYAGLLIAGLRVETRKKLAQMVETGEIKRILIAIPSLSQIEIGQLVKNLSVLNVEIQVLPSYVDLISGKVQELKTVSPDSLLGRNAVDLNVPAITKSYAGRVVMVTGAGGSIGSELCKQLLDCQPTKIVLFEQSELALYDIEAVLRPLAQEKSIDLTVRLGSVCDRVRVDEVLSVEAVEIVLHAAAYKHVPMVEANEVEGARNNVMGTRTLAEASMQHGVERFILISTDKAVRPTNIMGATKRLAELVLQDLATRSTRTRFSMVRFGNVLGSSGSVLPLFQRQIRQGGPLTVTHQDVTRFFMTIPEAARLVLLAGAFSEGGDVFVLDMGEPVRIIDIARRMIEMSGARVLSDDNPNGIEIRVIGLRPGEKLYEELLIDDETLLQTPHEKILRASEAGISQFEIARVIKALENAISNSNASAVRALIESDVEGYRVPQHA